jgi:hypothetical protein
MVIQETLRLYPPLYRKFCPEMDIYVVVDGDEADEAEAVGVAPRCALTTMGVDWLDGVGLDVDEMVV